MVSHGAFLRKLTENPTLVEQLRTNYRYADLEPRERAMLDFAVKLTEQSSACTERDIDSAIRFYSADMFSLRCHGHSTPCSHAPQTMAIGRRRTLRFLLWNHLVSCWIEVVLLGW